jgi:hypothetical protein
MPDLSSVVEASEKAAADRRSHSRKPVTGPVWLNCWDTLPFQIRGQLLDCSASGFRAFHDSARLRVGQAVTFLHARGAGRAVVVWNRVLPDSVQSGFHILR